LDGVRYTARKLGPNQVTIRTRSDTECLFFDQIKQAISQLSLEPNVILDGEFYSKKIPFKTLNGYCNRKKMDGKSGYANIPREELESIHYNIFDCYFITKPNKPFEERYHFLEQLLGEPQSTLQLVPVFTVDREDQLMPLHNQFVEEGFEGLMVRNKRSQYKLKDRSNDLLKYKNFLDSEFDIAGATTPSNGKEEGCIIWVLSGGTTLHTVPENSPMTFTCRPRDTYESRKADWIEYNKDPNQFIGQKYTVRYQETYDNGIPRFPVGIAIRGDT
jgi:ATP-dependent DNA ligase